MAFRTSRTSTVRGRPPRFAGRINGATSNHSASVRSLSYRRPRRSAAARWSGFHMRHLSPTQVPHKESQPIPETQLLSGWALSAAASALGLVVPVEDPTPRLLESLRDRELLLVLDNCEHVV